MSLKVSFNKLTTRVTNDKKAEAKHHTPKESAKAPDQEQIKFAKPENPNGTKSWDA